LGETKAAIERLCQLASVGKTSLCPKSSTKEANARVDGQQAFLSEPEWR
jgi:hypothetical protein